MKLRRTIFVNSSLNIFCFLSCILRSLLFFLSKVRVAAAAACERLGRYRMPLAWTAIHLSGVVTGGSDMDNTTSVGSLDRKSGGLEQWRKKVEPCTRRGSLERRNSDKRRSWSPDDFANCFESFR